MEPYGFTTTGATVGIAPMLLTPLALSSRNSFFSTTHGSRCGANGIPTSRLYDEILCSIQLQLKNPMREIHHRTCDDYHSTLVVTEINSFRNFPPNQYIVKLFCNIKLHEKDKTSV